MRNLVGMGRVLKWEFAVRKLRKLSSGEVVKCRGRPDMLSDKACGLYKLVCRKPEIGLVNIQNACAPPVPPVKISC